MFRSLTSATRRRVVIVGAGALTVAAIGAGTSAAFATSATPTATASTSAAATHEYPGVGAILRQLPMSFRADLKTLHKDSKSAKPGERKAIRDKALKGQYGPEFERLAHIVAGKDGGKAVSVIPAAMRTDLKTLRKDAKGSDARAAELKTIWTKATGGSYGSTIETAAKAALQRYQQHQQHRSSQS